MLKNARDFYALGFAIHLIKPKSKMPVKAGWTKGPRESWESLQKSYRAGMNIGVRLGRASRLEDGSYLGVIDCDVKSVEPNQLAAMRSKLEQIFTGETLTALSGRGNGSMHLYIKSKAPLTPRRLAQSTDKVRVFMPSTKPSRFEAQTLSLKEIEAGWRFRPAWEISLMGEGQQVVLPPSIHPDSGKAYKWLNGGHDIAEFEDAQGQTKTEVDKSTISDWEPVDVDLVFSDLAPDVIAAIMTGDGVDDRSAYLFKAAIAMERAGFSEQEILSVLTDPEHFLGNVAYEHAQTKSRKRAAQWVLRYTLKKAKAEVKAANDFDEVVEVEEPKLSKADAATQTAELLEAFDWRTKIERNQQDGRPKNTFFNIKLILQETMEGETFLSHNEFSLADTWLIDTPWGSKAGKQVSDGDSIRIKNFLVHHFRMEPAKERIEEVLIQLAQENSFHPVRELLDDLEWDGEPRLDDWLKNYLGAVGPEKYLAAVGRKTILAMVKRIYKPGAKYDTILVLEGKQGCGKSTTASILGFPWYSDTAIDIRDKDAKQTLQGVWVLEIGELAQFGRADERLLKNFITSASDRIRLPYGRRMADYPRQCVFIGTTNDDEYLKDKTGNRRYWPVKIKKLKRAELIHDRDQLLAEAKWILENLNEPLYLEDPEVDALAFHEQGLRMESDDLQADIKSFLDNPGTAPIDSKCFRVGELIEHGPAAITRSGHGRALEMRIANCLKALGYERTKAWKKGMRAQWWEPKK